MKEYQAKCPNCQSTFEIEESFVNIGFECPICSAALWVKANHEVVDQAKRVKVVGISKEYCASELEEEESEASPALKNTMKNIIIACSVIGVICIALIIGRYIQRESRIQQNRYTENANESFKLDQETNNEINLLTTRAFLIDEKSLFPELDSLRVRLKINANRDGVLERLQELKKYAKIKTEHEMAGQYENLPTGVYYVVAYNDHYLWLFKIARAYNCDNCFNLKNYQNFPLK